MYRVCHLGCSVEAAFVEKLLRAPPVRVLSRCALSAFHLTRIMAVRQLRVVSLHGPGLARLGLTATIATGQAYADSRTWARRIHEHPEEPDGILYRCRHDDDTFAVALFDRARSAVNAAAGGSVRLELSPEQRRAVSSGDAHLELHGRIEVLERRMAVSVSLARGAVGFNSGQRLRVLSVNTVGETVLLDVSHSRIGQAEPWQTDRPAFDESEYALINRALNEALLLQRGESSGTGLGLVIPGNDGFRETVKLTAEWPATRRDGVEGGSWLVGAELLRFEWHSVGSYPVFTEVAASPPSPR